MAGTEPEGDIGVGAEGGVALSVVIATRRRPELLARCLARLAEQHGDHPYEVVVVNDDDEPLGLPGGDPRVRVVQTAVHGVAGARNSGVTASTGVIVAFTDDDVVPGPGWVDAVIAAFERHPRALAVCGPIVVEPFDRLYHHAPTPPPGVACGANLAFRREAYDALGGFDERFRGWMPEDVDLAARARRLGSIAFAPAMVVRHPPRRVTFGELVARGQVVEGTWLLFRKNPELSRWRMPLRWGPPLAMARSWLRMLGDHRVVRGSPVRVVRIVGLAFGSGAVAMATAWRRWPGQAT
ncbi:MAG: hypothetical protein AMXMBFR46_02190 [Acidimicrobiia bacterium]